MLSEGANQLMGESARALSTNTLRPYPDSILSSVFRETRALGTQLETANEISTQLADDPAATCQLMVSALAAQRNGRCLLAFHHQRLQWLKQRYWEKGAVASVVLGDQDVRRNMSAAEVDFMRKYSQLVMDYKGAFIDAVDISGNGTRPPSSPFIQVRVLKDCGEIETESGTIKLNKGSQFYVKQPDVERLLMAGVLEQIFD
ncbi:GINS complex, Psf1 component [Atractiella rhizophila]|nr:GINS complex, Psf1 component [Atractiella rhizophila]